MNVALNITSIPAQEAFLVDAPTPTSPNPRWIQVNSSSGNQARRGYEGFWPMREATVTYFTLTASPKTE